MNELEKLQLQNCCMLVKDEKYSRIVVVGSGKFALDVARLSKGYLLTTLIENELKLSQFGTQSKRLCLELDIEYHKLNKKRTMEHLLGFSEKTLVLSAVNFYLFSQAVVEKSNLVILNYHNALLPKHPGRNAEAWQIYCQEQYAGITWHYINEKIDDGFMVAQKTYKLEPEITAGFLFQKLNEIAFETVEQILPEVLTGNVNGVPLLTSQDEVHYSHDTPNGGELSLSWDYTHMSAFLRSMDFGFVPQFPPAFVEVDGKSYCWKRYKLLPEEMGIGYHFEGANLKVMTLTGSVFLRNVYRKENSI